MEGDGHGMRHIIYFEWVIVAANGLVFFSKMHGVIKETKKKKIRFRIRLWVKCVLSMND